MRTRCTTYNESNSREVSKQDLYFQKGNLALKANLEILIQRDKHINFIDNLQDLLCPSYVLGVPCFEECPFAHGYEDIKYSYNEKSIYKRVLFLNNNLLSDVLLFLKEHIIRSKVREAVTNKRWLRYTCDNIHCSELEKHLSFWNNAVHRTDPDKFTYPDPNSQLRFFNDLHEEVMSPGDYDFFCGTKFEALENLCSSNHCERCSFLGDLLKKELSRINENLNKIS